jgi:hypothetical protein
MTGCAPGEGGQRLDAVGELVGADGVTPRPDLLVYSYELTFVVAGDVEIHRLFTEDAAPGKRGIRADAKGLFTITSADLGLSYDWERDELVCGDVCVAWDESCHEVTEEVCLDTCTYEECWDECWDDCSTTCWDETVCEIFYDEDGYPYEECWVETFCEDDCTTSCEEVCDSFSEGCNCHEETYEECDEVCVATEEHCEWVTRTYTSYPSLAEIVATRAAIRIADPGGETLVIRGRPLEAHQRETCDDDDCELVNEWIQRDRFVLPFE